MCSTNSVLLVGRLAEDPVFNDGPEIGELKIVIEHANQGDGKDPTPVVVPVAVYGRVARECNQRLKKNALVSIEGSLYVTKVIDGKNKRPEVCVATSRLVSFSPTSDLEIQMSLADFD